MRKQQGKHKVRKGIRPQPIGKSNIVIARSEATWQSRNTALIPEIATPFGFTSRLAMTYLLRLRRPSTKEYLDFLGFSQASLAEVRGGVERFGTKGYLKLGMYGRKREEKGFSAMHEAGIPVPSRNFPYPPVVSRRNPSEYGRLRERLREYTGREIKAEDLTLEIFTELVNKTDYLISKAVFGLQEKVVREEKEKFSGKIRSSWKPWKK